MSIKGKRTALRSGVGWLALVLWLIAPLPSSAGSGHQLDFNAFMNETQLQTPDPDRITLVWWLPEELWEWSLAQDQTVTDEGVEEFLSVLRPYVLLAVADGALGPMGGVTFVAPQEVRNSVVLVTADGQRSKPLAQEEISPDARNLATMMTPLLTSMLGPMGENLNFLFFPATGPDGEPKISATREGGFAVEVGDQHFQWKTPLGSVLPPKYCPVDGEEMSGAWTYCPFHGKKLVDEAPQPEAD
jgi:hypothetical protein